MAWSENHDCPKCGGMGWLWWDELSEYHGPANERGWDDTKYACDDESHTVSPAHQPGEAQ